MKRRGIASGGASFGRLAPVLITLGLAACSGARHRKVAGPPPEYEPPDDPGSLDGGAPSLPTAPSTSLDAGAPEAAR
jgi:hypothetical protein